MLCDEVVDNIISSMEAFMLGIIFIFIGYTTLTMKGASTGLGLTLLHYFGLVFLLVGIVSMIAGILIVRRLITK